MYSRILRLTAILGLVVFLCACVGHDEAHRYYLPQRYAAKSPEQVQILHRKPDREFIVMADLQARGRSEEWIRKQAAKIGADAVIIAVVGGLYSHSEKWAGDDRFRNKGINKRIIGTAIKFK